MKTCKKLIAVLLAAMLVVSAMGVVSFAADEDSVSAKFLNLNVAGLPDFSALLGKGGTDKTSIETQIGQQINAGGYDVVGVQEDFNYHSYLVAGLTNYAYQTKTSGGVPGGDGLNVYTKNATIYDCTRVAWNKSGGNILEGDCMTPKGIVYTVLDFGNGILVDFYDLHADAFDGAENALVRADQYQQLMDMVNANSTGRPVIITGDFNTSIHINESGDDGADEVAIRDVIMGENGFKDAWIELCNGGSTTDFSNWSGDYWGNWDSVEKFFYRDGTDIKISAADFSYVAFTGSDGSALSDHNGATCTFTFTKTADFKADTRSHSVKNISNAEVYWNTFTWVIRDLITALQQIDVLIDYIGQ